MTTPVAKLAVTASVPFKVRLHVELPVQAPVHEANTSFGFAVAVRATLVSWGKVAAQVVGQSIPAGLLVTVPAPVPVMATVNVSPGVNDAVTAWAALIATVHAALPEQAPLHPWKK